MPMILTVGGRGQVWIIAEGKFGKLVIVTWNVYNIWSHTWTRCYHAICIQNMYPECGDKRLSSLISVLAVCSLKPGSREIEKNILSFVFCVGYLTGEMMIIWGRDLDLSWSEEASVSTCGIS